MATDTTYPPLPTDPTKPPPPGPIARSVMGVMTPTPPLTEAMPEPQPHIDMLPLFRGLDTNNDGRISRPEIRQAVGSIIQKIRTTSCSDLPSTIPTLEGLSEGLTNRLTQGTPAERQQAETEAAARAAAAGNTLLSSSAAQNLFPRGSETIRTSDVLPAVEALGQRLRHCGLNERDAPRPDPEEAEVVQHTPRVNPRETPSR